jgi:hypothetical protein
MNRSEPPNLDAKLAVLLRTVLTSEGKEIHDRFGLQFIRQLLANSKEDDSENYSLATSDSGYIFRGYPACNHLKQIARVLQMWHEHGQFPITFLSSQQFGTETTDLAVEKCNTLTHFVSDILTNVTEPQVLRLLEQFLMMMGPRGLLTCLGVRQTQGSVEKFSLPSKAALARAFNQLNSQEDEENKGSGAVSQLTVGARALTKHSYRSSEGYWGRVRGTEAKKNSMAEETLKRLLNECVWMNIHCLPNEEAIVEVRVEEGYGARWFILKQQGFRGFIEPQMVGGHEKHWRH